MAAKSRPLAVLTIAVQVSALIFGIIALGAPNWVNVHRTGSSDGTRGLWMNCYSSISRCLPKGNQMESDGRIVQYWHDWEKAAAGFMSISVGLTFLSVLLAVCSMAGGGWFYLTAIFSFFSGACLVVCLSVYGHHRMRPLSSDNMSLGWAFVLAIISCLLTITGGVTSTVGAIFERRNG